MSDIEKISDVIIGCWISYFRAI